MNVTIHFPREVESALRSRAAAAGQDVETFVRMVVADSLAESGVAPSPDNRPAEFRQRLESWIALHPKLDQVIDDSRESIYAGCGE